MAELGLIDILFHLVPESPRNCTYHVFKTLWIHYGVARVQVCRIDPINMIDNRVPDFWRHHNDRFSESYYDFMQDLYRCVLEKILLFDDTVHRIWCIYALYTLYTTQSPPPGVDMVPISLPSHLWSAIASFYPSMKLLHSNQDPFTILFHLFRWRAFTYTSDFDYWQLRGGEPIASIDAPLRDKLLLHRRRNIAGTDLPFDSSGIVIGLADSMLADDRTSPLEALAIASREYEDYLDVCGVQCSTVDYGEDPIRGELRIQHILSPHNSNISAFLGIT